MGTTMKPLILNFLDLSTPEGSFARREPDEALIRVDNLGITRGDGIFETAGVIEGVPLALEAHLARFARSASMLDLPEPNLDLWRRVVVDTAHQMADAGVLTGVKFCMTRGIEGEVSAPTGWALGFIADDPTAVRRDGIDVVKLDRGFRHDVAETSPWLLQGAKTLSYAVNKAALREAARRGATDVIFTSTDGYILEGPSSSLVARIDGVYVTPPPSMGILPGTTQGDIFTCLERRGLATRVDAVKVADLDRADGVWLCSSTRGAAPVRTIDGNAVPLDHAATELINGDLDARRS
ncbi:aminodeoxychorismate lyase [Acidipropionibacterium jensenii]|uniref:aminodeoxychorismate lyase n=1 Tax=Acidipropionibacterium jensenii TaxID=1749 RepID=UPI0026487D8B|nr:aminodeoxychorismate lyase [Acidipropionibacterium jensenii]MDN6591968.1 aminodeoxychorismate lyase [Acidipropionibacterium jensenii]